MQNHAISSNTMQYHAIPCNTMQYHAIQCNTMQYHAIPCNTMLYHAILCNTMQYHAIPCIINNCWRSVPLLCGQYNGHFLNLTNRSDFSDLPQIHFWQKDQALGSPALIIEHYIYNKVSEGELVEKSVVFWHLFESDKRIWLLRPATNSLLTKQYGLDHFDQLVLAIKCRLDHGAWVGIDQPWSVFLLDQTTGNRSSVTSSIWFGTWNQHLCWQHVYKLTLLRIVSDVWRTLFDGTKPKHSSIAMTWDTSWKWSIFMRFSFWRELRGAP